MQVVNTKCARCAVRIQFAVDGIGCANCERSFCNDCLSGSEECPDCGLSFAKAKREAIVRQEISASDDLRGIDLSGLSVVDKETLRKLTHPCRAWEVALFCAALKLFVIIGIVHNEAAQPGGIALVSLKLIGYVVLGYWARSWSPNGTLLLLIWHIFFNYQFLVAESFSLKLMFVVPALYLLSFYLGANKRSSLVKKAEQGATVQGSVTKQPEQESK